MQRFVHSGFKITLSLVCVVSQFVGHSFVYAQLNEVVVSYAQNDGKLRLFRVKEDGSSRRPLTDGNENCLMPVWSPDGKKIAYVRQQDGSMNLWVCNSDGTTHKQLTRSGKNLLPSWLPDSKHLVWMVSKQRDGRKDPASESQLWMMNTNTNDSRPLFSDKEQSKFSNAMPAVSPDGKQIAFVSNRSGGFRVWLSKLDGSKAIIVSPVRSDVDKKLNLPIEQKVPAWSPDGKWIAHWEGVEMIHMSRFTGKRDAKRDQEISNTWNVWLVELSSKDKSKAGRGDDPNFSPDGFVTRSFPDPRKGGANILIREKGVWRELNVLPPKTVRYGRFAWRPK